MSFKRGLAGAGALGLTCAVSLALAGPSWAGDGQPVEIQLDADVTPTVVAPGGTVTVSSVDPCPAGTSGPPFYFFEKVDDPSLGDEGPNIPLEEDGSWTVTFTAPTEDTFIGDDSPLGEYVFGTECQPPEECFDLEPETLAARTSEPEIDCSTYFYEETFTVEEPTTPSTTVPSSTPESPVVPPPPATPIVRPPDQTG